MSGPQMQRELEVLILLGERLQEEVISERRQHQITKQQLSELTSRLEEEIEGRGHRRNGRKRSNTSSSSLITPNISIAKELNELPHNQMAHLEDLITHGRIKAAPIDAMGLRSTLAEMIGLADLLLLPRKPPPEKDL